MLLTPGVRERHAGARCRQVVRGRATRHRRDGQFDLVTVAASARRRKARRGRSRNRLVVSIVTASLISLIM